MQRVAEVSAWLHLNTPMRIHGPRAQPLLLRHTNSLRQSLFLERQSCSVESRICHIGEPIRHSEYEQHAGVSSHRHTRIPHLNLSESLPVQKCTFGDQGR